ncbi:hypothetical protein SAMN05880501_104121 [Ureibacillus xyleni]|uniref:Uncharacterized protein n=1 Tax=Ureibacillus xyleni TaxID=614648 RepID=A0A285SDB0_9BACL|nr:hypothetical protein [Ureibacillus xyleni]SOC05825.1 hypothetical protein SAMN05880501_104121 [Ureibacillus xyleni]
MYKRQREGTLMDDKNTLFNMYAMLNSMQGQLNQCKTYLESMMEEKGYDFSTILEDYDVALSQDDKLMS